MKSMKFVKLILGTIDQVLQIQIQKLTLVEMQIKMRVIQRFLNLEGAKLAEPLA